MALFLKLLTSDASRRRLPPVYAEANMTVTNVIELVVVLAILYVAYRFFQKRG
jgi:hypothetical protein